MPTQPSVLNHERLTTAGALLIPSRLSADALHRLVKLCGGRRLALLTEASAAYEPEMRQAIASCGLPAWERGAESDCASAVTAVHNGTLLICVPPAVAALRGSSVLVPLSVLEDLCEWNLPVQPLGVDLPRESALSVENTGSLAECVFCFAPTIPAGQVSTASVRHAAGPHQRHCRGLRHTPGFPGTSGTAHRGGSQKTRRLLAH
jgi:hypothetical protein